MKATTRDHDLGLLEDSITSGSDRGIEHRKAILDSIYEQAQDSTLEKMRRDLANWVTKGLYAAPQTDGEAISLKRQMIMAEAEMKIRETEEAIQKYTRNPEFQARLAQKVAKRSEEEANLLYMKGIK